MPPTLTETDITEVLRGPRLNEAWQECLLAWADAPPSERAACLDFAAAKRDALLRVLRDVTDPHERETVTAVCYIKVKSSWILLNTQAGYQIASGTIDGSLFCRAALLSALLGEIEPFLRNRDLDRITGFLSQPVDSEGDGSTLGLAGVLGPVGRNGEVPPPPAPGGEAVVVDPALLEAHIHALNQKIAKLEAERREIADELGYSDVRDIIAMFHRLEGRAGFGAPTPPLAPVTPAPANLEPAPVAAAEPATSAPAAEAAPLVSVEWSGDERRLLTEALGTADPQEIVAQVYELRTRLEALREFEEMLGSMEMALQTLDS